MVAVARMVTRRGCRCGHTGVRLFGWLAANTGRVCCSIFSLSLFCLCNFFAMYHRPYVRAKGRKFEKARGRRASRGFKV